MATPERIEVHLVTPQGPIAETEAGAVAAPGALGEFEVLPGHVPFLTQLRPGVLRLGEKGEGGVFAVSTGFLEVEPTGAVQVLVERAVEAGKVDVEAAKAELAEAGPQLESWKGDVDADYRNLQARCDWARAQLQAAGALS